MIANQGQEDGDAVRSISTLAGVVLPSDVCVTCSAAKSLGNAVIHSVTALTLMALGLAIEMGPLKTVSLLFEEKFPVLAQ